MPMLRVWCHLGSRQDGKSAQIEVDEQGERSAEDYEEYLHGCWYEWACDQLDGGFEILENQNG